MTILTEIDNLIILIEDEYYDGRSFIDRHKGKLLAAGAVGLAHSGYLGTGAQDLVNTGARTIAQVGQKALNLGQQGIKHVQRFGTTYPIPGRNVPWMGTTT